MAEGAIRLLRAVVGRAAGGAYRTVRLQDQGGAGEDA